MKNYFEFLKIEWKEGFHNRGAAMGRFAFYGVILFVFSNLWKVVAHKTELSMSSTEMLWYLAMTELVALCFPMVHLDIEEDVRSGNLAYSFTRPTSYLWSRYARALGATLSRSFLLLFSGVFFAYIFSGGWPENLWSLAMFVPLFMMVVMVGLIFQVAIGISSFWIQDCAPIFWVWQKMSFVLGGMILPLDIYPDWLKSLALKTPFALFHYLPAKAALTLNENLVMECFVKLSLWGFVAIIMVQWMYSKACKGLVLNGG